MKEKKPKVKVNWVLLIMLLVGFVGGAILALIII